MARRAEIPARTLLTYRDAAAAGYTRDDVRQRVHSGQWHRVLGPTFLTDDRPPTTMHRILAAGLLWPECIVGFRAAAFWHSLPVTQQERLEVYTSLARRPTTYLVPCRAAIGAEDTERRGPRFAVTTTERTIIDCLARLPWREVERLLAFACTRELLDHAMVERAIVDRAGRPGVSQLREVAELTATGAVNRGEKRLQDLLDEAGLRGWRGGQPIRGANGRRVAHGDIVFLEERVVIELDGWAAHQGASAFQDDRRRQNKLALAGYTVLRFTWADVRHRPREVVGTVRRVLDERRRADVRPA